MRAMRRRLMLGMVGATLAGMAVAQPMGPGMMGGPGAGRGPGFGRGMTDPVAYLAGLKSELGITAAQEAAWGEYAETVTGIAKQMQAMHAAMFEKMQTATWQERRDMMDGMFASRNEAHRIVQEAAQKLLPSLSPEQKSKAATELPGLIGPGPGMGGGMGPGTGRGMGRGMMGGGGPGRSQ